MRFEEESKLISALFCFDYSKESGTPTPSKISRRTPKWPSFFTPTPQRVRRRVIEEPINEGDYLSKGGHQPISESIKLTSMSPEVSSPLIAESISLTSELPKVSSLPIAESIKLASKSPKVSFTAPRRNYWREEDVLLMINFLAEKKSLYTTKKNYLCKEISESLGGRFDRKQVADKLTYLEKQYKKARESRKQTG